MSPKRIVPLVLAVLLLVACGAVDSMKEGFKHSQAVASKLEGSIGLKCEVGFNWYNGSLTSVTVTFAGIPDTPSLPEISARAKAAVLAEFKQTPKALVVAFSTDQ